MKKRKYITDFDKFLTIPIAHRGLHGSGVIENTLRSFEDAIQEGFGIEIDVRLTKDKVPVVFHDGKTKRLLFVESRIEDMTLEQIKQLQTKDGSKVPTFEQTLQTIGGKVPLLVEFKVADKNFAELTDLVVAQLKDYDKSTIAFQSFYPDCIRYATKKYPEFACGQLTSGQIEGYGKFVSKIFSSLAVLKISHADFVSFDIEYLPNKYVQRYRKRGGKVLCWLVDSEEKRKIAKENADNIIFENKKILN